MANEKQFRDPTKMIRLIDANALIATLEEIAKEDENNYFHLDEITQEVFDAPTVETVEVVHGRWEDMSDKYDKGKYLKCSVCGKNADNFVGGLEDWYCLWKPNYCPNCGAKMDGDGNG